MKTEVTQEFMLLVVAALALVFSINCINGCWESHTQMEIYKLEKGLK